MSNTVKRRIQGVLTSTLNDTHAIILARGGSKGIKNKNLLRFNGNSILGGTIQTIKNSGIFENIWVSTDSDLIEMEAIKYDALVYRRLHVFAQDHSSSLEAVREFLYKHTFVKKFALFQCTSVFLKEKYIVEAFNKFKSCPCVFAAKRSHKLRWKQLGHNLILPLNFNPTQRPRRQDWEGEFYETGMFYFSTKQLVSKNSLQNNRCAIIEVDAQDAIEIDNLNDFKMAQCMLEMDLLN
ncbi:N-acylneuraminate cytidylyltransferase [Calliphora vicina]|uniref:N-acylneuraminate cytidylyltransferase n=1 Tax=Calliphora vicina TaxID=7373 RepID=UPI00325AEFB8